MDNNSDTSKTELSPLAKQTIEELLELNSNQLKLLAQAVSISELKSLQ
jgi:hypothetical protein